MNNEELLKVYFSNQHILQSWPWGEFKTLMGTKAVTIDKTQMTMHKIPFTTWKVGYCPKIKPGDLDLGKLYQGGRENGCLFIKLDVPHAPANYQLPTTNYQVTPGKPIFAQSTILMDLTKNDDELFAAMHEKTRYNLRLAQKKGVTVVVYPGSTSSTRSHLAEGAVERFIGLQKETAERQKFFIHPDHYYRTCFETLAPGGLAFLLEASVADRLPESTDKTPGVSSSATAASWMIFRYGDVLYYPYGESNYELRSYMASNLLMWESIQLGKKLGCKVFDLWGAADDPSDEKGLWHGFTRFKLSFGGIHVKLAPTHDLVINKPLYNLFNLANTIRWKILRAKNG